MASDAPFNPNQIEIVGFSQTLVKSEPAGQTYRYEVTLALHDALGTGFVIERLTLQATGFGAEMKTQAEVIRLLLQTATAAIAREQAGTRPGSP